MQDRMIVCEEVSRDSQDKVPVNSAILSDIQRKIQAQSDSCSCSDYENCQYENRD